MNAATGLPLTDAQRDALAVLLAPAVAEVARRRAEAETPLRTAA